MSALVVLALLAPVAGAAVAVLDRRRAEVVARAGAAPVAVAWGLVVALADDAVTFGSFSFDPVTAAAAAGLAFLVAAAPPHTPLGVSAALSSIALFPAAAASGQSVPDRPLGAGIVLLAVLAAGRFAAEHAPLPGAALACVGGVVVGVGFAFEDPDRVAVLVVVGAAAVVVAAAVWATPGVLLFPAVLLAVFRATEVASVERDGVDLLASAGAGAAVLAAIGFLATTDASASHRLALAGVASALVVSAQDLPAARPGALLLAAGAILAVVGRHPVALLALVPGASAVLDGLDGFDDPETAVAGAGVLVLFLAAGTARRHDVATAGAPSLPALVAAGFGVVPVWGWAGAAVPAHRVGVAVASAVVAIAVVGIVARRLQADPTVLAAEEPPTDFALVPVDAAGESAPSDPGGAPADSAAGLAANSPPDDPGTMAHPAPVERGAPRPPSELPDGRITTLIAPSGRPAKPGRRQLVAPSLEALGVPPEGEHEDEHEDGPQEGERRQGQGPREAQPGVAVPPQPVPGGPPGDRRGGRGRLRAGPGGAAS